MSRHGACCADGIRHGFCQPLLSPRPSRRSPQEAWDQDAPPAKPEPGVVLERCCRGSVVQKALAMAAVPRQEGVTRGLVERDWRRSPHGNRIQ